MKLDNFKNIISSMPELEHSEISKINIWQDDRSVNIENAKKSILDKFRKDNRPEYIEISRHDLYVLGKNRDNLDEFILATIIWGYPGGMRGIFNNRIAGNFDQLSSFLIEYNLSEIKNFNETFIQLRDIG